MLLAAGKANVSLEADNVAQALVNSPGLPGTGCFSSRGHPIDQAGDFITSVPPEMDLAVRGRKAGLSGEK